MIRTISLALVATALLSAGCIQMPQDLDNARAEPAPLPARGGTMTAEETVEDSVAFCLGGGGISLPDLPIYCAKRTITVTGEMTLAGLPVDVRSGFADIVVIPGDEGVWSLVATIEAAGPTEDTARAKLDMVGVSWSIEDGSGHALQVLQEAAAAYMGGGRAELLVTLPSSAVYGGALSASSGDVHANGFRFETLDVDTSSGDIALANLEATVLDVSASSGDVTFDGGAARLSVDTSSGDITVSAQVGDAALDSSSGDIHGVLDPVRSGDIKIGTSSGDVTLVVEEDRRHGYDLSASTSSGGIEIRLDDGDLQMADEDADEAHFVTNGYSRRDVRSVVSISTSSGDVSVSS